MFITLSMFSEEGKKLHIRGTYVVAVLEGPKESGSWVYVTGGGCWHIKETKEQVQRLMESAMISEIGDMIGIADAVLDGASKETPQA